MFNYILADYRRILIRLPRLLFVAFYEIVLIAIVIRAWRNGQTNYSSVDFINSLHLWVFALGSTLFGVEVLINIFSDDFKSKTMQVAIGIGVTRLQVVTAKLVQAFLILVTDILVTCAVLTGLVFVTGANIVPQQIFQLFVEFLYILLSCTCWIGITSILVFKMQSLILPMIVYIFLNFGVSEYFLRLLTRSGSEILSRIHPEKISLDHFLYLFRTNLLMERFHLGAVIGIIAYIVIGIYLTYLIFRKQELDF